MLKPANSWFKVFLAMSVASASLAFGQRDNAQPVTEERRSTPTPIAPILDYRFTGSSTHRVDVSITRPVNLGQGYNSVTGLFRGIGIDNKADNTNYISLQKDRNEVAVRSGGAETANPAQPAVPGSDTIVAGQGMGQTVSY